MIAKSGPVYHGLSPLAGIVAMLEYAGQFPFGPPMLAIGLTVVLIAAGLAWQITATTAPRFRPVLIFLALFVLF